MIGAIGEAKKKAKPEPQLKPKPEPESDPEPEVGHAAPDAHES
jgi:hypothetical protein